MDKAREMTETIIENEGNGYRIKGRYSRLGSFEVIAIEWEHPNYGYFADALLWIRSLHCNEWKPFPVVTWTERYTDSLTFLMEYPVFSDLFNRPRICLMELIEDYEDSFME